MAVLNGSFDEAQRITLVVAPGAAVCAYADTCGQMRELEAVLRLVAVLAAGACS